MRPLICGALVGLACLAPSAASASGASDLVGHWKFDEGTGTVASDSSGLGNHGAIIGTASYVAGMSGTALVLNGTNTHVNCGNASS
ncbi:MAG: hypothetical protein JNK53_06145, partial [Phycisphaerae bacterium]|nr:hypothetical protein [Phycisphaerae bacterium]